MQLLCQRLLHCPNCLKNRNSQLSFSIVVDQVVRLLVRRFIEKLDPGVSTKDHVQVGSRGGAASRPTNIWDSDSSSIMHGPSYSLPHMQPGIEKIELRIENYEILDEEFRVAFIKRLVRRRLRMLVGLLTGLQTTTNKHASDVQCSMTHQMLNGVKERIERLGGKMVLS